MLVTKIFILKLLLFVGFVTNGVDDVSAQTSCVISPDFDKLTIRNNSLPDVDLHCQCMDDNGIITETRWFLPDMSIVSTDNSNRPYSTGTAPSRLIIAGPFTSSDDGTYTCSPDDTFPTIPPGDSINLIAAADPLGEVNCSIVSTNLPNVTAAGGVIASGTQNVILYCICMRVNGILTVGQIAWFLNGDRITLSQDDGSGNPYSRNNVPSTLTIPSFVAPHDGNYSCTHMHCIFSDVARLGDTITLTLPVPTGSSPPQNVMITSVNPASLMVSWQPPPLVDHNGPITGYVIQYTRVGSSDMMSVNVNSGTTYTISGLPVLTEYSVRVAAVNVDGTGPFSNPMIERSGEDRPSAPESLDIIGVNSSSVMLQWRPPLTPNGVIVLYSLKYNSTTLLVTNTSSDVLMLTVEGLSSENVYIFQVTAHTKAGEGPPINLTVVIPPKPVPDVTIPNDTITSSELTLSWMMVNLTNSVLLHYIVFYSPVSGPYDRIMASNRRKRQSAQPGEFTMNFTTGTTGTLRGLNGSVTYRIQVAAVVTLNVNGQIVTGDRSAESEITTQEGVPTPPLDLKVTVTNNEVTLTWSRPDPPNGLITQYSVAYINTNTQDSNITTIPVVNGGDRNFNYTWNGLSQTTYNFIIVASTAVGSGEAANMTGSITFEDSNDGSSDDNNGAIIALATLLAISIIVLMISLVINVYLALKLKQSRYDVDQSNVRYSDVKQSVSRDHTVTKSISKNIEPSEPDYETVNNVKLSCDVKMDANPAYQTTS